MLGRPAVASDRLLARFVRTHLPEPVVVLTLDGTPVESNQAAVSEDLDLPALFAELKPNDPLASFLAELRLKGRASYVFPRRPAARAAAGVTLDGFVVEELLVILARAPAVASLEAQRQSRRLETLGLMTARVAHDLNNLLFPVLLLSSELLTELAGQESRAALARDVEAAATRAMTLAKDLLGFVRARSPGVEAVSINSVISALRPLFEVMLGQGIRLGISLEERSTYVRVDRGALELALLNLVSNSASALPHGGEVNITTANVIVSQPDQPSSSARPHVAVVVNDTGIGMTEQVQARAFDPFFTTRPERGGTGLGLACVRQFVEESGGWISLNSQIGRGTSVVLHLPRITRETPPPPAPR